MRTALCFVFYLNRVFLLNRHFFISLRRIPSSALRMHSLACARTNHRCVACALVVPARDRAAHEALAHAVVRQIPTGLPPNRFHTLIQMPALSPIFRLILPTCCFRHTISCEPGRMRVRARRTLARYPRTRCISVRCTRGAVPILPAALCGKRIAAAPGHVPQSIRAVSPLPCGSQGVWCGL